MKKTCNRCRVPKSLAEFYRDSSRADGLRKPCKACDNARKRGRKHAPTPLRTIQLKKEAEQKAANERAAFTAALEDNKRLKLALERVEKLGVPKGVVIQKSKHAGDEEAVACCLLSDVHCEEPVDPESVNGLNEYSPAIARERIARFAKNVLRLTNICARDSKIKTIWLGLLGDLITNYLHEENQELNELPPEEAAELAQNLVAGVIEYWLKESDYKIIVDCVAGNHGRMTKKRRNGNHSGTSLETFIYFNLAKFFRDEPRVEIRVARSKMLYRQLFQTFNMRIIHGDDIGYQGGIGGVTIPIRKKIAAWDKSIPAKLTVMGHFHQRLDGGDHMVNGSVIGYNAYAQGLGASPEPPSQQFFLVSSRDGGTKTITAPVFLTEKEA